MSLAWKWQFLPQDAILDYFFFTKILKLLIQFLNTQTQPIVKIYILLWQKTRHQISLQLLVLPGLSQSQRQQLLHSRACRPSMVSLHPLTDGKCGYKGPTVLLLSPISPTSISGVLIPKAFFTKDLANILHLSQSQGLPI